MFPLKQKKLIRGCEAHKKAGLGCGADYVAETGTILYAPFNGEAVTYWGKQGGNWLRLTRPNGDRIEFAHLEKILKTRKVKSGDEIALTGNTGSITTGPHLHIQIFQDNKRVDPVRYNWEEDVIIEAMYKEKYEQEVSDHKEDIKQKEEYYNNWQTQLDKAKDFEARYNETYDLWQKEIEARHKVENKLKTCQEGNGVLDKIRTLLGM